MDNYQSLEGLESIALPFASLFALPTMRSVMPGQPPLGEYRTLEHDDVCATNRVLNVKAVSSTLQVSFLTSPFAASV